MPAALDLYRRYLEATLEDVDPELRADAQQLLQAPREVGCEVSVQGDVGALLSVDGRIAGVLPLPAQLLLTAGAHQLVLQKNRRRVETQVTLAARRQAEVRFTLVPPLALLTLTPGVLLITQPSNLEPALALSVRRAVSEAAGQQNAVLVTPETQADTLARKPELLGCLDQLRCQEQVAQQTAAQFVLRLSLTSPSVSPGSPVSPGVPASPGAPAKKGGAFQFSGELLDVDVGVVSVQATQSCGDCNLKRGMQMLSEMIQEMLRQAATRPRGTIKISSEPAGARVEVDGRQLGETPYLRDSFVGARDVVVSKQGFVAHHAVVNVEDGQTAELTLPLLADAKVAAPRSSAVRIAKWTLLGVGAVSLVSGIAVLAAGYNSNFDGRAGGIPLVAVGSLALGTSAFLFIYDARQNAAAAAAPTPTANNGVGAFVRF